jgi:hypothetical protein
MGETGIQERKQESTSCLGKTRGQGKRTSKPKKNFKGCCSGKRNSSYLQPEIQKAMGVTRLKRKDRRNKAVANARVKRIKQLTLTPVIKKVDVEELKKSFSSAG